MNLRMLVLRMNRLAGVHIETKSVPTAKKTAAVLDRTTPTNQDPIQKLTWTVETLTQPRNSP